MNSIESLIAKLGSLTGKLLNGLVNHLEIVEVGALIAQTIETIDSAGFVQFPQTV